MNALEIRNLTKSYPDFSLDHLSLTLPGGCILGLIGENGAGKSTTIRLILDMIHKDSGSVTIFGKDNGQNLTLTKQDIGVVLDEVGIPGCLNAHQVGEIMGRTYRNWDKEVYQNYLTRFSLPERKPFQSYSRGMQRKLGLAIALSHHAKLLLLDEATSGLDPVVRDEVVDTLLSFARQGENAVLISSHIVSDLEKLCDYVAFLHKGKIMLLEEKDYLLGEYGLLHCTASQLEEIPAEAILHKKLTPYSAEALVNRDALPGGTTVSPISMEELFIYMSKEAV